MGRAKQLARERHQFPTIWHGPARQLRLPERLTAVWGNNGTNAGDGGIPQAVQRCLPIGWCAVDLGTAIAQCVALRAPDHWCEDLAEYWVTLDFRYRRWALGLAKPPETAHHYGSLQHQEGPGWQYTMALDAIEALMAMRDSHCPGGLAAGRVRSRPEREAVNRGRAIVAAANAGAVKSIVPAKLSKALKDEEQLW